MMTEDQWWIDFEQAREDFAKTGDEAEFRRMLKALGHTEEQIEATIKEETS